jgi:very-short-patch-repair endonuclease/predicted transcriptional regulator of viral defense system
MEPNPQPTPTPAPAGKRHHRSAEADLRDEIRPRAGKRDDRASGLNGGNEIRWRRAAELAASQQGVATTAQLRALGLSYDEILLAADTGRLHRIHRGVYLVGHTAMAPLAREQAALLACGEAAILSHVSAAALWQLRPSSPIVDVTVVGRRIRRRQAIRLHVVGDIDGADVSRRYGLAVTSAARTLVDLAAVLEPEPLEAALSEAYALRRITERKLHAAVERNQGRPGAAALRALLTTQHGPTITKSRAERLLRALLRKAGLPQPLSNQPLLGHPVDILWPEQHLIVEFDGFQWHGHRAKFETDRARDAKLVAAGYRVIRVTWRQLTETPLVVIANIARALGA